MTTILCGRQEQTNIALEERCDGLAETFEGEVISEFVGLDADPTEQENQIAALLQANPEIDAFMGTGPNLPLRAIAAAETAGRELQIAGFDISPDLITAIKDGTVAFTVDQQQYLQGYLPVVHAVPPGDQPEHRRRRPADPHRPRLRRRRERRGRRGAGRRRHPLS